MRVIDKNLRVLQLKSLRLNQMFSREDYRQRQFYNKHCNTNNELHFVNCTIRTCLWIVRDFPVARNLDSYL